VKSSSVAVERISDICLLADIAPLRAAAVIAFGFGVARI
jgi:hypothetical protein